MKYLWFTLLLLAQATMATAQEKETLYKTLDSLIANYDHQTAERNFASRQSKTEPVASR